MVHALIEDEERFVAQLGKLRPPSRSSLHRSIFVYDTEYVDLLTVVDLVLVPWGVNTLA